MEYRECPTNVGSISFLFLKKIKLFFKLVSIFKLYGGFKLYCEFEC